MDLTRDEVEKLAERAAELGVKKAFRDIGIQDGDPFEMRKDFDFLRTWRQMCEAMRTRGFVTAVTLGITAMGTIIFLGIKSYLSTPI